MDFWRRAARTYIILKVRNEAIREKRKQHKQFWKEWKITC
jgi:hypothetical protein